MCAAMRRCGLALLTARVLLAPAPGAAQPPASALAVPYVAQSEALCGGAAAAMVLRYWGERGVDAEQFASLLNARGDGIETGVLRAALAERGWRALAFTGTKASVSHHLRRGRPVIALIAVAPRRFHYVVIVDITGAHVAYHDPAGRPFELQTITDFDRAWSASSRWALLALPPEHTTSNARSSPAASPTLPEPCRPALLDAAAASTGRDWTRAEQHLNRAQLQCPSAAAPLRERAGLRLLQGRADDAAALARVAVHRDATDVHAWKILGTAEFLRRNPGAALDAWNRAGEPVNDLVRVEGLTRTRHRVITDRLGVAPGALLTSSSVSRAGRRLRELPAGSTSRVDVAPVGGGLAEVHAAVFERPLVPTSPLALGALGVRALATREATWRVSSPTGAGERLDLFARWWEARRAVAAALSLPVDARLIRGVVRIEGSASRESFAVTADHGTLRIEDRRAAVVSLSDWATANLRWSATARADRWADRGVALGVGGSLERHIAAVAAFRLQGDVWPAGGFGVGSLGARWRWMRDGDARLLAGVTAVTASDDAPRSVWGGAGTGHARSLLLRAHPLLADGVVTGEGFGRRLLHAGVEGRQTLATVGPVTLQVAAFADAAAVSRADRARVRHVDVGVGLRLRIPGEGTMRVDFARGLADRGHALSVGWELPWPAWP